MSHDFSILSEDTELQRCVQNILKKVNLAAENISNDSEAFSISSDHSSSSSPDISAITDKTKSIKDRMAERLSAFMYMSKKCYEGEESLSLGQFEDVKKSLESSSIAENKPEEIALRSILEHISQLQSEYELLQTRLSEKQNEMRNSELEEEALKNHVDQIEDELGRFMIETDQRHSNCSCLVT